MKGTISVCIKLLIIAKFTIITLNGQLLGPLSPSSYENGNRKYDDSLIYNLLTDTSKFVGNSEFMESSLDFLNLMHANLGDVGSQYNLAFTVSSALNQSYDYVIIGAGSAGATLAARLTEDSGVNVLLIEAGGKEDYINNIPVTAFLLQKTHRDWAYEGVPQKRSARGLNRDRIPIPRGKLVGGGSSINYMLYVRGNYRDYDRWAEMAGGNWTWADVFPYFVKSEGSRANNVDEGYHGTDGPLTVSPLEDVFPVDEAFLLGAQQYGLKIGDFNGADQERFMYSWYTTRDGKRCSTGRAYLGPASERKNLHLLLFARVNRLLINERKQAYGVEYSKDGSIFQVFARKEVILSAGAINTPQILMLSGIGPADHLRSLNIPLIKDMPGVGSNLQDHTFTLMMFTSKKHTSFVYTRFKTVLDLARYLGKHDGSFASPGLNVIGFYRTKYAIDDRPDIQIHQLDYIPGGAFPNVALGMLPLN